MNLMRLGLGIATIAVGISSCGAPANDAASTPTSHNEAPSWSMPAFASFSREGYKSAKFQPCRDIPDEVLKKYGYQKSIEGADAVAPYGCPLKQLGVAEQDVTLSIQNWDFSIDEMIDAGVAIDPQPVGRELPFVQVKQELFSNQTCEVLVETEVGTIGIMRAKFLVGKDNQVDCEPAVELLTSLFGG